MKTLANALYASACIALCAATSSMAEMRDWNKIGGNHPVRAEFVSATAIDVRLKREDGAGEISVAIAELSPPDQAYVAGRMGKPLKPTSSVLAATVKKVERMTKMKIAGLVAEPDKTFEVDGFKARVAQLIHGGAEMSVGGFSPAKGFGFGALQIRLSPIEAPASTDVCGFYLESPQGVRYSVHLLVIGSPDSKDGKRTLRDVRRLEFVATTEEAVIDNTHVFMIPLDADIRKFRLGFATPDEVKKAAKAN